MTAPPPAGAAAIEAMIAAERETEANRWKTALAENLDCIAELEPARARQGCGSCADGSRVRAAPRGAPDEALL
jgi:hypothetical protein